MKTFLIAAAMACGFGGALAAPSFAQDMPPPYSGGPPSAEGPPGMDRMDRMDRSEGEWSLQRREAWLQTRIDRSSERGGLSGNEEERGRAELQSIRAEEAKLRDRDGGRLSPEDRTYVASRIDGLNRTLRWQGDNPPPPWAERF